MMVTKFPMVLGCFLAMALPGAGLARAPKNAAAANYPANYEGGTLQLGHSKVRATLGADEVVLVQHGRRIAVPASSITEIDCATGVHRRLGAAVLDVVPYMHLGESESHYVGVTWINSAETGATPKVEVLFKLNKSEYAAFLSSLERLTGKKAVDTNQTRTAVHYD
ncbi:MAG: hypothetical protein ABSH42_10040 [Bryobacteraceae bacterium]|jgi:hypothetical protein